MSILFRRYLQIIKYIPLQQGLRQTFFPLNVATNILLSIFHYNKD